MNKERIIDITITIGIIALIIFLGWKALTGLVLALLIFLVHGEKILLIQNTAKQWIEDLPKHEK